MTLNSHPRVVSSQRTPTGISPIAWMVVGLTAMGVARAVEGIVEIGQEIFTSSPSGSDGSSGASAQPAASRVSHQMAGFFTLAAVGYAAKLLHRAMEDIEDVAREIGVARS